MNYARYICNMLTMKGPKLCNSAIQYANKYKKEVQIYTAFLHNVK